MDFSARCPIPISAFPGAANRFTVIPVKAGIECLGLDSGSPFHCARNDGERGYWYAAATSVCCPLSVIPAKAGIHSASAWIPGLRSTPPGMTGERGCWYLVATSVCRPPSVIPAKAGIHSASAKIPGFRSTPPGMTGSGVVGNRSLPAYVVPLRHSRESGNRVPRPGFRVSVSLRPE